MSSLILTPEQTALLFGLFGQAPPPTVDDALAGFSPFRRKQKLQEIQESLLEQGILATDGSGEPGLTRAAAETLAICFSADDAMTIDTADEDGTKTAYFLDDEMVAIKRLRDEVRIDRYSGLEQQLEWFLDTLGEPTSDEEADGFAAQMSTDELEALMIASEEGDTPRFESQCTDHGWELRPLRDAARLIGSTAPFLKATTVQPGVEGMTVAKLRRTPHGAWVMRFAFLGGRDNATLSWSPDEALLSAVRSADGMSDGARAADSL